MGVRGSRAALRIPDLAGRKSGAEKPLRAGHPREGSRGRSRLPQIQPRHASLGPHLRKHRSAPGDDGAPRAPGRAAARRGIDSGSLSLQEARSLIAWDMPTYRFTQVNVFSAEPLGGNPLAVVHAAEGLTETHMAALARWTNLSETTFLLPPTDARADYYVRIFTPGSELPFAGHPTLGPCHAWLAAGGKPRTPGLVVQQCGVGLGRVRCDGPRPEFAAPPLRRTGGLEPQVPAENSQGPPP